MAGSIVTSVCFNLTAQWNAYCSVIKAQESYKKACVSEGLCLITDHYKTVVSKLN